MKTSALLSRLVCLLLLAVTSAFCQQITVQKDQSSQVVLSAAEIAALPHTTVAKILEKAGITFGESLRGKRLASCLLVEAADGYRVVIALPELDPGFTDKQILLVDKRKTHPLDDKEGPYRIVIPDEKRMARWVRQVKTLKIVDVQ